MWGNSKIARTQFRQGRARRGSVDIGQVVKAILCGAGILVLLVVIVLQIRSVGTSSVRQYRTSSPIYVVILWLAIAAVSVIGGLAWIRTVRRQVVVERPLSVVVASSAATSEETLSAGDEEVATAATREFAETQVRAS